MKMYMLKFEHITISNGKEVWSKTELIRDNMDMIARYLVDADENPEKYRNVEFHIGEFEKVENIDIETISKLFL